MVRSTRMIAVGICALAVQAGCSNPNKERICKEYEEVTTRNPSADWSRYPEYLRDAAKVLEGLRGVPEADAYRRDLERMADAIEAQLSQGSAAKEAYDDAVRAMKASARPFFEYCFQ